jgi:hypothetical protein
MSRKKNKQTPKRVLRLPDHDFAKSAETAFLCPFPLLRAREGSEKSKISRFWGLWRHLKNVKISAETLRIARVVPRELFAVERLHLKPLPAWIPEVYRLHQRTVDVEGYVSVNSIRYSVPVPRIGRRVEVRETRDKIDIELDARHIVTHETAR